MSLTRLTRPQPDGKIEVHIPQTFTAERPPIHFTKAHFDVRMSEHPEASKLPAASSEPTFFSGPRSHAGLAVGPGAPTKLDDYLYSDLPQFALHVVTFEDGTLVSINFSHITSDASGLRSILDAWQLHLAGRPEAKAEFMSLRDGMAPLYESPPPQVKHVLADVRLSGLKMLTWIFWFMWDSWVIPYESRIVCVPKTVMDALVENARNDLKKEHTEVPFFSEGDVLLALAVRTVAHNLSEGSTRSINEMIAVDPRGRAKSVFKENGAYVQNAPSGVMINCSSSWALETNLGNLALHMRKAIAAQTTEEQMKVMAHDLAISMRETGRLPIFGDPHGLLGTSSNWGKTKLLQSIDFSPAIVRASTKMIKDGSTWKPGQPVYYHSRNLETSRGAFSTSVFIMMGRDHEGNMWLTGDYPATSWSKLMDILSHAHCHPK